MVLGGAMGKANGVLITIRDIGASERKAGRVERIEAESNAFVGTDRQRQFLQQQVAAIGRGFSKGATKLKAVAHLGIDACAKQQIKGFAGKKLRR
jgi:hypothetical protein